MGSHQPLLWLWLWASGSEGPDPLEDIQPTAGQSRLLLLYRVGGSQHSPWRHCALGNECLPQRRPRSVANTKVPRDSWHFLSTYYVGGILFSYFT